MCSQCPRSLRHLLLRWIDTPRNIWFSGFKKTGFTADATYHILFTYPPLQRLHLPGKNLLNLNTCLLFPSRRRHRTTCLFSAGGIQYHHLLPDMRNRGDYEKLLITLHSDCMQQDFQKISLYYLHSPYIFQSTITVTL